MNILIDNLPDELIVCGEKCHIRSDFKTWIKFTQIITNSEKIGISAFVEVVKLVFLEIPPKLDDAITSMMNFYSPPKKQMGEDEGKNGKRIFDFDYDAELIYSGFWQQYKIDLTVVDLHWWQFKALFDSLGEETQFYKVLQYRAMDISKIKDKEQKKFYSKMKRLYKLPDNRTEEEKENAIVDALSAVF